MSVPFEPLPPEEPPQEKRKNCLYTGITVILVISLLVSSGIGFVWLLSRQTEETAQAAATATAVDQPQATEAYTAEPAEQLAEAVDSNTPAALDAIAVPNTPAAPETPRLKGFDHVRCYSRNAATSPRLGFWVKRPPRFSK